MAADGDLQTRPERLQSATRALAVLDALAGHPGGVTPKAIAAELGLHLSTTYHLLNTLVAAGYATRCASCRLFRLGPRVPVLHETFVTSIRPSATATGLARALQEATGETALLCRLLGDDCVTAAAIEGNRPGHVSGTRVGMTIVAHVAAAGRVLLAWQPASRIDGYLARHELFSRVPRVKLGDPETLRVELARIRKAGFAVDPGDGMPEFCCIAAPLPACDGQVGEALALLVPRSRFEQELSPLVATVLAITRVAEKMLPTEPRPNDIPVAPSDTRSHPAAQQAAVRAAHHAYLDTAYPRVV